MNPLYRPLTDRSIWSGRPDALPNEYVYQTIQSLDLNRLTSKTKGYALLGFESDAGISRNLGNPGAKEGPTAFRKALAKCPMHSTFNLYDAGNVSCFANNLEAAQTELGVQVARLLSHDLTPVVIGGGHETAWGHFQGVAKHYPSQDVAILNFDAHFDLRPLVDGQWGTSGTPFRQIHDLLIAQKKPFHYYCVGIQPFSNTTSLFNTADAFGVQYQLAEKITANPYDLTFIEHLINTHQHIYVSICLDVFNAAIAPGVSAPQVLGIAATYVIDALRLLKASGKVITLDIVELSPVQDLNAQTAKLAASLLMTYLNG
jgi:formiminoglutamase